MYLDIEILNKPGYYTQEDFFKSGNIKQRVKTFNGQLHGKCESFFTNGNKYAILYYNNGKLHNEDGPAYQEYYDNGKKSIERYYINGNFHRENGPSKIFWHKNGDEGYEYYYLNDINYNKIDWINKLKEINSPYYEDQKMLYDMEKYNL